MKLFEITSRMPDGTAILKFVNGYTFEGLLDAKDYPLTGILKTPEGVRYRIPEFKEDIYEVFELIESYQLEKYKIKD